MNIYIPKNQTQIFLRFVKDLTIIDDYILDSERFNKQKIIIHTKAASNEVFTHLLFNLPQDTMIVDDIRCPNKEYILCVGEVSFSDFSILKQDGIKISILTIKSDRVRFNAWIHLSLLNRLYQTNKIKKFSSMDGQIEKESFFVLEGQESVEEEMFELVSSHSSEYIIRENKIFVKLLLNNFEILYPKISKLCEKIDIIDNETF